MTDQRILASSAVMAAGTVVSRISGYVRSMLLIAALGSLLHADLFTIANTIPNMVYILLAGGIFNAVLVPQLVRAMTDDPDGGEAYAARVVTLAMLFLGAVTVLLVVAAPWLLRLYLDASYQSPERAAHLESIVDLTRWCLPQVFLYGMFVLVGQILNARGRFGPMMWAPIANNLIAIAVLVTYLVVYGPATGAELTGAYTTGQEVLLGVGSTVGILAQLLILIPYLRAAGFTYRPRYDFRDAGLRHTLRLGLWTVLFVVVNQVAYLVVVRLASSGTADGGREATGYTVYQSSFLIMMVPHAIVTVSLATAILPAISRQAGAGRLEDMGRTLGSTLRTSLAVVLPFAALLPVVAEDVARLLFGWGAGASTVENFVPTLVLFGPGLVFFTVHYLMLRGFYALEQTRLVFLIQCAITVTNIAAAVVLVRRTDDAGTAPALVVAYLLAYVVGSATSYVLLRRRLGDLESAQLLRFLVRTALVLIAVVGVAVALGGLADQLLHDAGKLASLVRVTLVLGGAGVAYLLLARAFRIREVTSVVDTVLGRIRKG